MDTDSGLDANVPPTDGWAARRQRCTNAHACSCPRTAAPSMRRVMQRTFIFGCFNSGHRADTSTVLCAVGALRAHVRACVRACVRPCVRVCVCGVTSHVRLRDHVRSCGGCLVRCARALLLVHGCVCARTGVSAHVHACANVPHLRVRLCKWLLAAHVAWSPGVSASVSVSVSVSPRLHCICARARVLVLRARYAHAPMPEAPFVANEALAMAK